ncbi:Protein of unknown function [Pyronema omphalodes CBS 100304]|uniref:Uncharacterized protein n=1 Tax=Pyronema omphalodes (strain CBS 100304) TaxID=1076935 RepID=U4LFF8_PYROM|nr:Protein of unknown function [Pyronema omphalodes CBS 100304]
MSPFSKDFLEIPITRTHSPGLSTMDQISPKNPTFPPSVAKSPIRLSRSFSRKITPLRNIAFSLPESAGNKLDDITAQSITDKEPLPKIMGMRPRVFWVITIIAMCLIVSIGSITGTAISRAIRGQYVFE